MSSITGEIQLHVSVPYVGHFQVVIRFSVQLYGIPGALKSNTLREKGTMTTNGILPVNNPGPWHQPL